ncbi:hypothetical protein [Herbidospora sp. NBRC 101105]|uniref:alginate O-acetyltransferase AlgX-related protein n=1 Tax=Herbidospora sp. NBRC 101105 TaxID=3032195 RepID=UPI0024A2FF1A|nr:hypothetical protein [Herbidospora sp. NBRC 101105]GLX96492.1 hypothetical protein Hesp01_44420 [Herbidospora sp. NBRC 101105]
MRTRLAALLFFFAPAIAFAAGERAVEMENKPLPPLPALGGDWTAWATAHLPLRDEAVRANVFLTESLFGHAPAYGFGYPKVIEGEDGWLYFGDDVTEACRPKRPIAETIEALRRLGERVEAAGKRFVLTVAPDKTTVSPQWLPSRFPGRDCLRERKKEFWAALREADLPWYVDLRAPLEELQRTTGQPAYWRTDSHWTDRAAATYAAELARVLDPALAAGTRLEFTGRESREGDLGRLLGSPREETIDRHRLDRTGAALYEPKTVLIGDSFTRNSMPWLRPYFANLTYQRNDGPVTWDDAETVIVEIVERHLVGGSSPLLGPN